MLLQGGDDMHGRFPVRSHRVDRGELMSSPAARQIYLTFPADSTFSEEDVSNYFRYRARRHYWGSCFVSTTVSLASLLIAQSIPVQ